MNIGVIGGADGPTAIFLSGSISPFAVIGITALCIAVIGTFMWKIKKKGSKTR